MASGTGSSRWAGLVAAAVALATVGCHMTNRMADRKAELPCGVELPSGFYPVKGHSDLTNPVNSYRGWPRYIICNRDNMVMVYVPSQTITMGGGLAPNEVPARQVQVNHFYIDLNEVTNVQYDRFRKDAAERKCWMRVVDPWDLFFHSRLRRDREWKRPWIESQAGHTYAYEYIPRQQLKQQMYPEVSLNDWFWRGQTPFDVDHYLDYWQPGLNNDHPVRNVSWWEAWYYTKWAHKRLPTEAQWEAAARGDDGRVYPWGNNETSEVTRHLCNYESGRADFDGYEYTAPVLAYGGGVSPFGAFNMAGNVWEWCDDWYDPGRYAYPSPEDPATGLQRGPLPFGDRNYPNPLEKDIIEARVGPLRGSERAIHGGSFADPIQRCRVDSRSALRPDAHQNNVGFRCVLQLPPDTCALPPQL